MTHNDLIYRALGDLVKALEGDHATASFIGAVVKAPKAESVVVRHNLCRVEEDWLAAIERGLVFIGRAIDEDRQFIRSDGEVQPIEKVRHISKESVQHLSRHSDLITREQTTEDIVPDKLYTVERLSDYAVYENRFLYVLLLRIRDFVAVRYDAIMRAYRAYRGEFSVKKKVVTGIRRLNYEIRLTDEQDDVVSAPADTGCAKALDRMEKIRQSVAFYLRTPLMTEVSRADKIKSKITKTNVLRMDKNFREAVTLYEYLQGYEKDGYTIEEVTETLDPIGEDALREFTAPALLTAFLVYEHGLKLEDYLKAEFEKEEARRAEEAQQALLRAIKALKKRIEETGEGAEEYMLKLEARNAYLEADHKLLLEAQAKIEELGGVIDRLNAEIAVLKTEIEDLQAEIDRLNAEIARIEEEHRRKIEEMQREFEAAQEEMKRAHREELDRLKAEKETEIAVLKAAQKEELDRLKTVQKEELDRLKTAQKEETARIRAEYEAHLRDGKNKLAAKEKENARVLGDLKAISGALETSDRECEVLRARLTALRREHGLLTEADDFTTEEGFNALEHEFEVLGRMVREKWTDVKRILRKEFHEGIRSDMRKKKPKKSKEYLELSEDVRARRGDAPEEGANAGEKAQEPQKEPPEGETPQGEQTLPEGDGQTEGGKPLKSE